jgi:Catechol dioxygenase N terminus
MITNRDKIADALTEKALAAYSRIDNTRLRELVQRLIRHLHAFVKEAQLTDEEFETAWTLMAEMAKFTGDERNEFLLFCGLGVGPNRPLVRKALAMVCSFRRVALLRPPPCAIS